MVVSVAEAGTGGGSYKRETLSGRLRRERVGSNDLGSAAAQTLSRHAKLSHAPAGNLLELKSHDTHTVAAGRAAVNVAVSRHREPEACGSRVTIAYSCETTRSLRRLVRLAR